MQPEQLRFEGKRFIDIWQCSKMLPASIDSFMKALARMTGTVRFVVFARIQRHRASYSRPINPFVPAAAALWLARMIVTRRVTSFEKRRINLDGRRGAIELIIHAHMRDNTAT